jgi:hypothetical protein
MFQYATARTLAERLGCALLLAGNTLGRRFGLAGHWLGLDEAPPLRGRQQNGVLRAAFARGPNFCQGRILELALPWLNEMFFPRTFSPRRGAVRDGQTFEEFDEAIFNQVSGTWLSGWFQSENYFASNAERVRRWFQPRRRCLQRADEMMTQWPASPKNMAAVHVRRGDYVNIKDDLGQPERGWLLPMSYYRDAIDRIPRDVGIAVFSDDPEWAARQFAHRAPWVSQDNSAVLDMCLIARCRWNVIANSSFSWWAAWLNTRPDKVVIAPKYHLGWRVGNWLPHGIEVAGWEYFDVRD